MSDQIRKAHRGILDELVKAQKVTQKTADAQPIPESMAAIIPDIGRICKDEDALAAAVAAAAGRPLFDCKEDGVDVFQEEGASGWIGYAGVLYLVNLYDQFSQEAALSHARKQGWKVAGLGVISHGKLEGLQRFEQLDDDSDVNNESTKMRVHKRIESLIKEAASLDASDIHLQPTQGDSIAIRFRVDGELVTKGHYKRSGHDAITRVILENMCSLKPNISIPQDGQFEQHVTANKKVGLRVSSMPVTTGAEKSLKIVMRILGNNVNLANLDRLNMSAENLAIIRRLSDVPFGMFILTGPTGSGKTTTLNAILLDMQGRDPNKNYHTLEDPVEIQHEGMSHTECGAQVSFPDGLRAILRQDPDVVLVGEMRDNETAELGFKAAQTGHLVLSTLHTNNAHESLTRLSRMNIPDDLAATLTTAFIAQRLVKSLCKSCKISYELRTNPEQLSLYGNNRVFGTDPGSTIVYRANPAGCKECKLTEHHHSGGLRGRRGIIEILEMTPDAQNTVLEGEHPTLMRRRQIKDGTFFDLWDDGLRLVLEGVVGFEQLEKALKPYMTDRVTSSRSETTKAAHPEHKGSVAQLVPAAKPVPSEEPRIDRVDNLHSL